MATDGKKSQFFTMMAISKEQLQGHVKERWDKAGTGASLVSRLRTQGGIQVIHVHSICQVLSLQLTANLGIATIHYQE